MNSLAHNDPFQRATVVTLEAITPLHCLRGSFTPTDAPAKFGVGGMVVVEVEMVVEKWG